MTKIELINESGVYSIKMDRNYATIDDIVDYLVAPMFLAAGYHPQSIVNSFEGYVEEHKDDKEID